MSQPLTGCDIVVTRPARQYDRLVAALRAEGARVTAIPLLLIEPVASEFSRVCLAQLDRYDAAIFISQNAAEQAYLAMTQAGLCWPAGLRAFAVGTATAALLAEQGIAATVPAEMNSEGLLALDELQNMGGRRCIVFRGQGGREALATALRQRGAQVDYCELYRRCLPPAAAAQWSDWCRGQGERPALVCLNSSETLRHLQMVDPAASQRSNLTLLLPGERVARAATAAGFRRLLVAPDATDNSTVATARQWQPEQVFPATTQE